MQSRSFSEFFTTIWMILFFFSRSETALGCVRGKHRDRENPVARFWPETQASRPLTDNQAADAASPLYNPRIYLIPL